MGLQGEVNLMTAQRSDLMTAKPIDPNRLEPWALSLVPFHNPQVEIPNLKHQISGCQVFRRRRIRCHGRETQKLKPVEDPV